MEALGWSSPGIISEDWLLGAEMSAVSPPTSSISGLWKILERSPLLVLSVLGHVLKCKGFSSL